MILYYMPSERELFKKQRREHMFRLVMNENPNDKVTQSRKEKGCSELGNE